MNQSDLTDEAGCRELCEKHAILTEHFGVRSPDPRAMSALAEAVRMMREKAAKRQDGLLHMLTVMAQNRDGVLTIPEIEAAFSDQAIRALQLTAEDVKRG